MPPISSHPFNRFSPKPRLEDWFTDEHWEMLFPYSKASSCFTHDGQPFWRRIDMINAIKWLNTHPNPVFHKFAEDSPDHTINLLELCAFLANFHQEVGDPSLKAPYPWAWPSSTLHLPHTEGFAGGALAICEGVCAVVTFGKPSFKGVLQHTLKLSTLEQQVIGMDEDTITGTVINLAPSNQPSFGLGRGNHTGAVFQPGLVAVSDNATLYGDNPTSSNPTENSSILPSKDALGKSVDDPQFAALGAYARYGGRGAIQLSYNFNYSECSLALFNDYRLAQYPNLIITTDRDNLLGLPEYFGFPGPNPGGNNKPPSHILHSTPPARILAWATCFWFWMDPNRSGRTVSCHMAMLEPYRMGITTSNMIINNDSGCRQGTWAWNKNIYYERVCRIMGIGHLAPPTLVCPPAREANIQPK